MSRLSSYLRRPQGSAVRSAQPSGVAGHPASPPASPTATRPRRAWWRDLRVVVGATIVIVCMFAGARAVSAGDDTVTVWRVNRALAAGTVPSSADVQAVTMPRQAAAPYAPATESPAMRLARDVAAGELLPVQGESTAPDVRWVTTPVEPLHAPTDLAPGERVDVWSTSTADLGAVVEPKLVLAGALVSGVSTDAVGFGGEYGVVLEVTPEAAGDLLAALRTGSIDLVRVP